MRKNSVVSPAKYPKKSVSKISPCLIVDFVRVISVFYQR